MVEQTNKNWYDRSYKWLLAPPAVFFIFCIVYLSLFYTHEGDLFYKDVSITGGTTVTVFIPRPAHEVEVALKSRFSDLSVREFADSKTGEQRGFFVETSASAQEVQSALESFLAIKLTPDNSSIEFTGAALSSGFYKQLRLAVFFAFFAMAIVVFFIFKTPFRSLSIIGAGFADIVMTIAVIDILGMRISMGGIVALLMLIGYAIDTDMLLTTRVLRGSGSINSRIYGAFKTGIMMTLTAIVAVGVSLFFTYSFSDTLRQIFTILLIGLIFDIINTWFTNASLLKWYSEVKHL